MSGLKPEQTEFLRLSREMMVTPGLCDSTGTLGIASAFELFMNIAMEHAERIGLGTDWMNENGLFWLTVKTRVKFFSRPALGSVFTLLTWPEEAHGLRCNRDYEIRQNGRVAVAGKTEWTVLNASKRTFYPTDDIYPSDEVICPDLAVPEPFSRIHDAFEGEPFARYTVKSTDIDFGGHMNNVAYVRALAGLFTVEEWNALHPADVEVVFRTSCYEGNVLSFYRKEEEGAYLFKAALEDGRTALLVRILDL